MSFSEFQPDADVAKRFNQLPKSKLRRIVDFIARRLEHEISLRELAGEAGLSMFYFARLFKQTTGLSPLQFVLEQRIEYAKYLLVRTDDPLVEIALRCGWANQSHFTTVFKQRVGVTPRRYRYWHLSAETPAAEERALAVSA